MAFASTITDKGVIGDLRYAYGTYTSSGGSTGGDIDTGLTTCEFIDLQSKGSGVATNAPVVNETLPVAGSAVTIVTDANEAGYWYAIGK